MLINAAFRSFYPRFFFYFHNRRETRLHLDFIQWPWITSRLSLFARSGLVPRKVERKKKRKRETFRSAPRTSFINTPRAQRALSLVPFGVQLCDYYGGRINPSHFVTIAAFDMCRLNDTFSFSCESNRAVKIDAVSARRSWRLKFITSPRKELNAESLINREVFFVRFFLSARHFLDARLSVTRRDYWSNEIIDNIKQKTLTNEAVKTWQLNRSWS